MHNVSKASGKISWSNTFQGKDLPSVNVLSSNDSISLSLRKCRLFILSCHVGQQFSRVDERRHRSAVQIAGDFLNEGEISITYGIDTIAASHVGHASARDIVRFRVTDRMDPGGVRGNFPLTWRHDGVRPRLQWVVEKTN